MNQCDVDSSYDSDDEATGDDVIHEHVSRTNSDTLGQEFSEYINDSSEQESSSSSPSCKAKTGAEYTQRVEFALKLGYTERLVQVALSRLGRNPNQNELLAELIKLGAIPENQEDVVSSNHLEHVDWVHQPTSVQFDLNKCTGVLGPGEVEPEMPRWDRSASGLRPIVIDGSNVAMSHGNNEVFSCRGIKLCVDWFRARGHKDVTVFVPKWRKENVRPDNVVREQQLLTELEQERHLVCTPSRFINGKRQVCYDDRYVLKYAFEIDGIVVSNDNYRDLVAENNDFRKVVNERLLMYSFVNDIFMPPDDPMGRSGPTLDNFLRFPSKKTDPSQTCPYGRKCTYGNKCKFLHPERGSVPQKTVTERLSEHAAKHIYARNIENNHRKMVLNGKSLSVPLNSSSGENYPVYDADTVDVSKFRRPLARTRSAIPDFTNSSSLSKQQPPSTNNHQITPSMYSGHAYNGGYNRDWSGPNTDSHTMFSQHTKANSIENMCRDGSSGDIGINQPQQAYMSNAHPACTPIQVPTDDCSNLHGKLQRQLTLNPAGSDPRIHQIQRNGLNHYRRAPIEPHHSSLRTLGPSASASNHPILLTHQNLTRMASAPETTRSWPPQLPVASSSESHNHCDTHTQTLKSSSNNTEWQQDHRRHLHFHLSSIFPEYQVQQAMQLYPNETNAQTICAAILNNFPKF